MTNTPSVPRPYGRVVLAWIIGFFMTFIVVDIIMVTMAVTTQTGLVTDKPYEKGLAYNDAIAAARAQESYGWRGEVRLDQQELVFVLRDENGGLVIPDTATVMMKRPTQQKMDQSVAMRVGDDGTARGVITDLSAGQWQVELKAQVGDRSYLYKETVVVE